VPPVRLDGEDVEAVIAECLCALPWQCVVGGGVRRRESLFEQGDHFVLYHAPDAAIAFKATAPICTVDRD
jgi:hypothetical protein